MKRMVRFGIWLSAVFALGVMATGVAAAGEPVDVAVFELTGQDIDDDLLQTLSGVLRQEALQHDAYSLANPATIQRDEIALVVGCDPDEVECLRQMGEFVDGQVLIFGDVQTRGQGLEIAVEIFDIVNSEEVVRVERGVVDANDPVVAFRREVEAIFRDLESIGDTHLVVEAPRAEMTIYLDGSPMGRGRFERQGMEAGTYRVSVGESGSQVWEGDVELEPGQVVEIRPEVEEEEEAGPVAEASEMQVEARTVVPGESTAPAGRIGYDGKRSNVGAFSLMGVGTLSLAASGIMVMQMRSVENQIRQEHAQGILDESRHRDLTRRGESYQTAQYVLLSVGAASLTSGASWAIWNYSRDRREERRMSADVTVLPAANGLSIVGRW